MSQVLRVGLLEDEGDIREFQQRLLIRLGYEVVFAVGTCGEFLDACRHSRPDLIIVDVALPDGDGRDAAATVFRERPVPIIVLSAYGPLAGPTAPALVYLVKPVRSQDVALAIDLALRKFTSLL